GRDRYVYLWGESAAGKTHLLQALASDPATRYIAGATAESADFDYTPAVTLYLLDDTHLLGPQTQIDAFNLFNHIRDTGGYLVSSGNAAPLQLNLREDLRTRLGWGLIYQVHGLSDEEKIAALTATAQAAGLPLSPGVLPYLLSHFRRDMRSLSTMLTALDRYSLETKRPITLPLLRSLLQETPPET
ncbi:MAG TPA: DnaA/Hda family protein, partial [Burkholderiaceae bacterium]